MTSDQTTNQLDNQPNNPVHAPSEPASELPLFPTVAPEVFSDPSATDQLFKAVFAPLAEAVDVPDQMLDRPTPCSGYRVEELRVHVLGWLSFFADALNDPAGVSNRIDPESWTLTSGRPGDVVDQAAERFSAAIGSGVHAEVVTMSQARMPGDGVLAMALGEYLVHGWDLAIATDRAWPPAQADEAAEAALAFLQTTVAPEHRGPDSGFFDREVEAPANASPFERLLCFGGRDPQWPNKHA